MGFICTCPSMLSQIHSGLRGVYNKDVPQQGRRSSGAKRCPLPRWPSANPPFGFWAALQTRPRSCDTAAGSWEASRRPSSPPWRPDTPLEAAPEEGDSSALLAASQRTQALPPAPRASRVCRGSAGRTLTQPGASWMKSLKNCLMRLCQTEGSASSTHSRPRPGGHS